MKPKRLGWLLMLLCTMLIAPQVSLAQEEDEINPGLLLTVPFPGVSVEPGDRASFDIDLTDPQNRQFVIGVQGVPTAWSSTFRGGGSDIHKVTASPEGARVDLNIEVPFTASEGAYPLTVTADADDGESLSVGIEVVVEAGAGGDVTLTPDFAGLRGPSDSTFRFRIEITNDTAEEVQLELVADGPEGWRMNAQPSGESQASTVSVGASSSERVEVEAVPAFSADAGDYEISFRVRGEGIEKELPLTVQITGDPSLQLSTGDQRLNTTVTAGEASEQNLLIINNGTTVLQGVELRATQPRNWDVTFSPEVVNLINPGQSSTVTATITPADNAIAGDYRISFTASVDQAQDSVEIRATVNPSAIWGLVGVGVIALTLGALALVFRRYGRR